MHVTQFAQFAQVKRWLLLPSLIVLAILTGCAGPRAEVSDRSDTALDWRTFTASISKQAMSSRRVDTAGARNLAKSYLKDWQADKESLSKSELAKAISAARFGDVAMPQIMAYAQRLAELELADGPERGIAEQVKLEIALAALERR